jgi:kynurenine formamidase
MSRRFTLGILSVVMIVAVTVSARAPQGTGTATPKVTKEQFEQWKKDLNNWGRWGKDDEIGTMNFITPAKRKQAAALVKEGFSVSLASDADTEKAIDNPNPYEHEMLALGTDRIGVAFHGITHTHIDSLAHINYDGVFYNGYKPDPEQVKKANGHAKNSIHNLKNGIFTRGILIDIPQMRGVKYLEPGTPIYVEDIEAWLKKTGLKIQPGDAVFVRAGVWARRKEAGPYLRGRVEGGRDAGLDPSVIPWLKKQDIAILAADHPQYVSPSEVVGAVHDFALVSLGIHLMDNCDLEALSAAAAARKRWEFLLTAAPLPVKVGTESPLNPIATF